MRIGKAFLLGVAGSALIASGAMAADLPTVPTVGAAPPAAPVFGWAGPYAGASGGYDTVLTSGFYGVQSATISSEAAFWLVLKLKHII